ncbi:MAG: tRNA 2-thiouridine(34) synthase MnmA [Thermoleophilia bacterium]|nr:tRNA 2-thiouridine(34) synthase MnmA [Thermoleophilia bacterium]
MDHDPSVVEGCAGGSCGVIATFYLEVVDGVIVDASARVRGRASAFATASALCESAIARSIVDAAALGIATLHPSFAAMDDEDRERALVVEDAFHHAIGSWLLAQMREGHTNVLNSEHRLSAIVGMSGGVDSAVALHLTHDAAQSGRVAGVTLQLWIDPKAPNPDSACCSPDSVRRARVTCHAAGLPHFSLDLRRRFAAAVVAPFLAGYRAGETPNPCVTCNGSFRLDELVSLADVVGAEHVVTGHYVRTVERDGVTLLQRGVDERKDQSYMLARLNPKQLERYRFPLGGMVKPDVRALAASRGLEQAKISDSQEACFLGGGDYRHFLERTDAQGRAGVIRRIDGEQLGTHTGIGRFTPGQRRGIAVPATAPGGGALYVISTNPATGDVIVGGRDDLATHEVHLRRVRVLDEHAPAHPMFVQLRYRTRDRGNRATLERTARSEQGSDREATAVGAIDAILRFADPISAPAPGQLACLYDEHDVVIASGTITRSPRDTVLPR